MKKHTSFLLIVLDAIIYMVVAYHLTDSSFIYIEKIVTFYGLLFRIGILIAISLIAPLLIYILDGRSPSRIAVKLLFQILLTVLIFSILPYYFVTGFPWKSTVFTGFSNNWIPMDWHRLYLNLVIMWHASKYNFVGLLLFSSLVTYVKRTYSLKISLSLFYCLLFAVLTAQAYRIENIGNEKRSDARVSLAAKTDAKVASSTARSVAPPTARSSSAKNSTLIHYNFPLLPLVVISLFGFSLWFSRVALVSSILLIITIFYFGLSPLPFLTHPPDTSLFTRIFPQGPADPRILLNFTRDGMADREGKYFYQSYGPTSGIAKIDIATGRLVDEPIDIRGLIRFFWTDWDSPYILGANYISFDIHLIEKTPFRLLKSINVLNVERLPNSPFAIAADFEKRKFYIVYYEDGGVGVYDMDTLAKERAIYFKDLKISEYRTGGFLIAFDEKRRKIIVPAGVVDRKNNYKLLKIDADTLKVEEELLYPAGGLGFIYEPSINRAFNTTFYENKIYEFEIFPRLKQVRTYDAPWSSKCVRYDPKRDYLYATSFATGELYVIERSTGKTIYRTYIGNKAENLYYHPLLDKLFISSAAGIFTMDMKSFDARIPR